jgi:hypothetical protein
MVPGWGSNNPVLLKIEKQQLNMKWHKGVECWITWHNRSISGSQRWAARELVWCPTGINTWSLAFLTLHKWLTKTINDNAKIVLFSNNTNIIISGINPMNFKSCVNKVFQVINRWFTTDLLSLNVNRIQFMQFITKTSSLINLNIMCGNKEIVNICNTKFLGLTLDNTFSWKIHIDIVVPKLSSVCFAIRTVKPFLAQESLKMVYYSCFHSVMTYRLIFWGNSCYSIMIFRLQKRIVRIMVGIRDTDLCR